MPEEKLELEREAYAAWDREAREHVGPAPAWDTLPNGIKNAWAAAIERVLTLTQGGALSKDFFEGWKSACGALEAMADQAERDGLTEIAAMAREAAKNLRTAEIIPIVGAGYAQSGDAEA